MDNAQDTDLIKKLNGNLKALLDFDPLTEFTESAGANQATMNYGLAQIYAIEGFRFYIQTEINRALKATATRSITMVDMAAGKARALTLKELLVKGKIAFEELQKIQAIQKKKQLEKNNAT